VLGLPPAWADDVTGLAAAPARRRADSRPDRRRPAGHGFTLAGSAIVGMALTLGVVLALSRPSLARDRVTMGVTFSPRYATSLGLDPAATYRRMLGELDIAEVRLPIYWDEVERSRGVYDLTSVEQYLTEAERHGVSVIPVLGYKAPRWPECHPPDWAREMSVERKREAILDLVGVEIERLRVYSNVTLWQIENEPFFPFGDCERFTVLDRPFVAREVALARRLDRRPVLITDSGELSPWVSALQTGDRFGTSLYRSIWFEQFGLLTYPIPPDLYAAKDRVARRIAGVEGESIVSELQAEPWFTTGGPLTEIPVARQAAMFPPGTLRDHVRYARETGASAIYFWGVEWWYWMEQAGHPEYVREVRRLLEDARHR
jgi:hypothetical protein